MSFHPLAGKPAERVGFGTSLAPSGIARRHGREPRDATGR
jgi:hypothetical protein